LAFISIELSKSADNFSNKHEAQIGNVFDLLFVAIDRFPDECKPNQLTDFSQEVSELSIS
jgi:hypothetical protein